MTAVRSALDRLAGGALDWSLRDMVGSPLAVLRPGSLGSLVASDPTGEIDALLDGAASRALGGAARDELPASVAGRGTLRSQVAPGRVATATSAPPATVPLVPPVPRAGGAVPRRAVRSAGAPAVVVPAVRGRRPAGGHNDRSSGTTAPSMATPTPRRSAGPPVRGVATGRDLRTSVTDARAAGAAAAITPVVELGASTLRSIAQRAFERRELDGASGSAARRSTRSHRLEPASEHPPVLAGVDRAAAPAEVDRRPAHQDAVGTDPGVPTSIEWSTPPGSLAELARWGEQLDDIRADVTPPVGEAPLRSAGALPATPGPDEPTPAADLGWATDLVEAVLVREARRHGIDVEDR